MYVVCIDVMNLSEWPIQMMVASSALHAVCDIVCLVNIVYSVSILFRLLFCVCTDDSTSDHYRSVTYLPTDQLTN